MSLLDNLITVRRVLEREMAQAAVARLTEAELAALAEYNKALAGLAAAEGGTLTRHSINLNVE